ncbi:hypothetical protein CARUB_v10024873mg, partial [Capsella rubella]
RANWVAMSDSTNDAVVESASSSSSRNKKISYGTNIKLPMDLIMKIFKRVPAEILASLCVSKPLASIIRDRDFKKLFLAESSTRPGREVSVATYHRLHPSLRRKNNSSWLHSLICYESYRFGRSTLMVYNSSTRSSTTLPDFDKPKDIFKHMLGYDPVDGVYKVLCMKSRNAFGMPPEVPKRFFEVLTLGDDDSSWRMIQDSPPCMPFNSHICIDGVLYYDAYIVDQGLEKEAAVMSFDLRSEQFGLIKGPCDCLLVKKTTLLARYEGKLAIISIEISANGDMVLWVLEDAVKHKWAKKVFVFPSLWKSLLQCRLNSHRFLNITDAGEFILVPRFSLTPPSYVMCYDSKTQRVRKVVIEGLPEHNLRGRNQAFCSLYYLFYTQAESLMFL